MFVPCAPNELIAHALGPGQLLDRFPVSPPPCAPRCTYVLYATARHQTKKPRPFGRGSFLAEENLTYHNVTCSRRFKISAIVTFKISGEYFLYLLESWDCLHTKLTWQSKTPQEFTYVTGQRRRYVARSFRSIGLTFRPSWPVMVNTYRHRLTKSLMSI